MFRFFRLVKDILSGIRIEEDDDIERNDQNLDDFISELSCVFPLAHSSFWTCLKNEIQSFSSDADGFIDSKEIAKIWTIGYFGKFVLETYKLEPTDAIQFFVGIMPDGDKKVKDHQWNLAQNHGVDIWSCDPSTNRFLTEWMTKNMDPAYHGFRGYDAAACHWIAEHMGSTLISLMCKEDEKV
jgi:hypothetical protein